MVCSLCAAIYLVPARAQMTEETEEVEGIEETEEIKDAFPGVRLTAETLPEGMEITEEIRATPSQVLDAQKKLGFPLTAVLNQTITYREQQARVNYMAIPTESWLSFGYSKLMKDGGANSMALAKGLTLIQMVATTKDLEDRLLVLLEVDLFQTQKIRFHRTPQKWSLLKERFLTESEFAELELKSGGRIRAAIEQEMIVRRTTITVTYLDCRTEQSADRIGKALAREDNQVTKRLVRGYGPIVVYVDSSNSELNEHVLAYLNW